MNAHQTTTGRIVGGLILMAFGLEAIVEAHGGVLRTRQQAGPFIVSIFTAAEPLRAGPVEVSVLVQSSNGSVLTGAVVDLLLESATPGVERRQASATHDATANKLAKAAVVDLPVAGQWTLTVSVRFNADAATVTCQLPVAPAGSRMRLIWPWLLLPPVGIALFATHQALKRQRTSARSPRRSMSKAGLPRRSTAKAGAARGRA